jgi:hypothetical protein
MKLDIPQKIEHHGEKFILESIKDQQREALKICKKLKKKSIRSRIKFISNKYVVYGDENGKKKNKKKKYKK